MSQVTNLLRLLALLLFFIGPAVAHAQKADAEGFVPESRPAMSAVDNSIPASPLVATAYGIIWVAVMGFVLYTLKRTHKVEQEIADLEFRIKSAGK